jgi:CheY-like chemotaxis protein
MGMIWGRVLVLIADSSSLNSTCQLLHSRGYHCDIAATPDEAMDRIRTETYDLVIADGHCDAEPLRELLDRVQHCASIPETILLCPPGRCDALGPPGHLPTVTSLTAPLEDSHLLAHVHHRIAHAQLLRTMRSLRASVDAMDLQHNVTTTATIKPRDMADHAFHLTLQNMAASLLDLDHLWQAGTDGQRLRDVCSESNCPRTREILRVLQETVSVLEQTRHSFKSSELAVLRKKLRGYMLLERMPAARPLAEHTANT